MAPESVAAATELNAEGVAATVIHLTAPGRVYRGARAPYSVVAGGSVIRRPSHLHRLVPVDERSRPVVSVHDAASHNLSWIGSALGTRQFSLGVDRFGESGTISDLYAATGISAGDIVNAALVSITE